jgi:hypothetical protein
MIDLTVTLARLKEEAESEGFFPQERRDILVEIEKAGWAAKKPRAAQGLPLAKIEKVFGLPFALWALRCAEPPEAAQRIGRLVEIDLARAGLDVSPADSHEFARDFVARLEAYVLAGADLEAFRNNVGSLARLEDCHCGKDAGRLEDEVAWVKYGLMLTPFHGGDSVDPDGDFSWGGLYGVDSAVDSLGWLLVRGMPEFAAAKRVADLAEALEKRWQEGTRLDFAFFADEIEPAIAALEKQLTPAAEALAWSIAKASWDWHVNRVAAKGKGQS